jgi:hypothetical protein
MKTQDSLSRDDLKPFCPFAPLRLSSEPTKRALKRAASHGVAILTPAMVQEIDRDWIMVPSKKGLRQVVCNTRRAFRY